MNCLITAEVLEARHANLSVNQCGEQEVGSCEGHCDPASGQCVCRRGHQLKYNVDGNGFCDGKYPQSLFELQCDMFKSLVVHISVFQYKDLVSGLEIDWLYLCGTFKISLSLILC